MTDLLARLSSLIETRYVEALTEIRRMGDNARHFINRSAGQHQRRIKEGKTYGK